MLKFNNDFRSNPNIFFEALEFLKSLQFAEITHNKR